MAAAPTLRLPALRSHVPHPSTEDLSPGNDNGAVDKSRIDVRFAALVTSPTSHLEAARDYLRSLSGPVDITRIQEIRQQCLSTLKPPLDDLRRNTFYKVVEINCNAMVAMLQSSSTVYFPENLWLLASLVARFTPTIQPFSTDLVPAKKTFPVHVIFPDLTHLVAKAADAFEERESKAFFHLPPHPNIVSFYGVFDLNIRPSPTRVLGMQFSPHGDLLTYLNKTSYLSPMEVFHTAAQAASAVNHLHEHKIIHRDIKPENFVLEEEGGDLKLIDFEMSQPFGQYYKYYEGTARYLCPEHVAFYMEPIGIQSCSQEIKPSSDIWCLGHLFASLLKMKHNDVPGMLANNTNVEDSQIPPLLKEPNLQQNIHTIIDDVIAAHAHNGKPLQDFGALTKRCLSVNPKERPSASDVDKETKKILASLTK